ncbi:hypothetical protein LSA01_14940 [Latilactobacillus sakei]|jgi:uncharacterized protein YpuA (DUF1002 family)|uniref:DUF1002 domain-containing protein n=1 Tax=Latilactobacillus sakei TaxID=1599 RepID=A0A9N7IZF9_LATSK|nr:DUF1002 domain-containing protein [Latilactobacillus sakei]ARJ72087.1 hypothetical protein LP065_05820 [Latilactobacillus sakei]AST84465.1 DUF1002 domain-containing protein [Latilactobacillus sakei]AWZ42414.1 DUF1002 domain-containing protein [Latilactobacillus sakei]AWZ46416.1 DUF1002 domain-containing protein [Latilactobacillus sakei]AYG15794.1 DUF1002 domain-containing protein [Latilactobacillus sakei]
MFNKLKYILPIVMTAILGLSAHSVFADSNTWDKPVATLGTSLSSTQKSETLSTLQNAANITDSDELTVTGSTLVKYLDQNQQTFNANSNVYSSALIQKNNSNTGINVKIVDFNGSNNITTITANQYKNAALTAGVTNATIYVTSAVPIDGSGALAGVYAAFAENGETLNQSQVTAAQDEMSTLSDITQANKGTDGYTDSQLNNAVTGAKKDMANKGDNLTVNQITNIVNNQLEQNNLTTIINNNQKTQIINLLVKIQDSGALKSDDFKNQAGKLMDNIQSNAKNVFDKLNTESNRNFIQKLFDSIGNFFKNLFG